MKNTIKVGVILLVLIIANLGINNKAYSLINGTKSCIHNEFETYATIDGGASCSMYHDNIDESPSYHTGLDPDQCILTEAPTSTDPRR